MGFGGSGGSSSISSASDAVISTPTDGQALVYNTSKWRNAAGGSGDPTMGGDLSGTASNAQIAASAVGATELASNAVTTIKVTDAAITEPKLAVSNAPSTNQVLSWDGTNMTWVAPASGAVTIANLPAGSTLTVAKSGGVWPARPTSRSDIIVQWKGPDPSPTIVASGTGGMLDNVDIRFVTP